MTFDTIPCGTVIYVGAAWRMRGHDVWDGNLTMCEMVEVYRLCVRCAVAKEAWRDGNGWGMASFVGLCIL